MPVIAADLPPRTSHASLTPTPTGIQGLESRLRCMAHRPRRMDGTYSSSLVSSHIVAGRRLRARIDTAPARCSRDHRCCFRRGQQRAQHHRAHSRDGAVRGWKRDLANQIRPRCGRERYHRSHGKLFMRRRSHGAYAEYVIWNACRFRLQHRRVLSCLPHGFLPREREASAVHSHRPLGAYRSQNTWSRPMIVSSC